METILTVLLLLGIAALILKLFTSAIGRIWKLLCNGVAGLLLLMLTSAFGSGYGIELPVNLLTIFISLVTGVFGVVAMIILQLFF